MPDLRDERDDVVAAGSICPIPDCGALVVAYRPPDRTGSDSARPWWEHAHAAEPTSPSLKMN